MQRMVGLRTFKLPQASETGMERGAEWAELLYSLRVKTRFTRRWVSTYMTNSETPEPIAGPVPSWRIRRAARGDVSARWQSPGRTRKSWR